MVKEHYLMSAKLIYFVTQHVVIFEGIYSAARVGFRSLMVMVVNTAVALIPPFLLLVLLIIRKSVLVSVGVIMGIPISPFSSVCCFIVFVFKVRTRHYSARQC